ncbi:hypothetical protein Aglo01_06390 [Actinokineospora globicatena]|nr:hypothetical protein Aglo01_06390 [Actinokineospora globicatena]GLW82993.1 hypothetical protein Aglo02_06330 [Actinokineospora globicatena]
MCNESRKRWRRSGLIAHRHPKDALSASFAEHHDCGQATNRMPRLVRTGEPWRDLAANLFDGNGS